MPIDISAFPKKGLRVRLKKTSNKGDVDTFSLWNKTILINKLTYNKFIKVISEAWGKKQIEIFNRVINIYWNVFVYDKKNYMYKRILALKVC